MKQHWVCRVHPLRAWLVVAVLLMGVTACAASPMPAAAPAAPEMAMDRGAAVAEAPAADGSVSTDRKVVARAQIDLVVADAGTSADAVTALVETMGGYVTASNLYRASYTSANVLQGSMTVRVPAERLDEAMTELERMAVTVTSRTINREDVTDQYSDTDSRLRNLEATETELRAMLTEVRERPGSTTEDIMSVYRTLTDVRGEIEQLRGRKNMFDNLIALSTIEVRLTPDVAELPVTESGWRPSAVVRSAQRALVSAVQSLADVLIWAVIFVLPVALLVLLPLVLVGWLLRLWFRRMSKHKPAPTVSTPPAA